MNRNFGMTGSAPVGGNQMPSPHYAQVTQRDSNVYYLPPSPSVFISPPAEPDSSDLEFGAFLFALVGLCSPFAVTGALITIWLLFFS